MKPDPFDRVVEALGDRIVTCSDGHATARCPCSIHSNGDRNPSLSVDRGDDRKALLKCHAGGSVAEILSTINLSWEDLFPEDSNNSHTTGRFSTQKAPKKISKIYQYLDATGILRYEIVRFEPKTFRQRRPAHDDEPSMDGYVWGMKGVERIPYHLNDLAKLFLFSSYPHVIRVVEGEKDSDLLWSLDPPIPSTTNPGGAGKWTDSLTAQLASIGVKSVIIHPDNDLPGYKHAHSVATSLLVAGMRVEIIHLPDVPEHGDVSDFFKVHNEADLLSLPSNPVDPDFLLWYEKEYCREKTPEEGGTSFSVRTDTSNAERLVRLMKGDFHFIPPWDEWIHWNNSSWQVDHSLSIENLSKTAAREIYAEASNELDESKRRLLAKWAEKSESFFVRRSMVTLARSEPTIPLSPSLLDSHLHLLTVKNGTLNLNTGVLEPSKRENLITKHIPINFNPDATCPRWTQFLHEIMNGNTSLISFLQRATGYTLTGHTTERCFFLLWGGGANGKSVFVETLAHILGQYTTKTSILTFTNQNHTASNDLARLKGARFVYASESGEHGFFDESRLKEITGGEKIEARFLYREFFEFNPECKIWITTNHLPKISGTDNAVWDRVRLIPFQARFEGEKCDPELKDKLLLEAEGILAWATKGSLLWHSSKLQPPPEVLSAVNEYRSDQDTMGEFIQDNCLLASNAVTPADELYSNYKSWSEASGERRPMSRQNFGRKLKERGLLIHRSNSKRFITGIVLRNEIPTDHYTES